MTMGSDDVEAVGDRVPNAFRTAAIGFAAGCVGGVMGIIVGQPFDTIKVRLQTHSTHYTGPMHCARHTLHHEGVRGLFKGLLSPLVGSVPINAIVFGVYGSTLDMLDPRPAPALSSVFNAGCIAGFLQSFVVCPTDLVKCQLQVQDGFANGRRNFANPLDCMRYLSHHGGGAKGLFQGLRVTLLRDTGSYGVYFGVYEGMRRWFASDSTPSLLVAGGLAGVVSWTIVYPIDVVKSVIQTMPPTATADERRILVQARRLVDVHGASIFTKGLGTTMLRAFPVNAVTFYFYEWTVAALS
ncbi:Aste57867_16706 [Aphanomyces stellatus]|uniref:Aste57867_16706 protein n=1 Tax=Aphanomyces stellatus TaxID=120398 RepID=A0A485L7M8_9STRA|nr:hypothetical protein As57867_016649 [Aphanomyces stellatus]VFT93476.1 Aste57867_16706 [Aphanomyces stellatus]